VTKESTFTVTSHQQSEKDHHHVSHGRQAASTQARMARVAKLPMAAVSLSKADMTQVCMKVHGLRLYIRLLQGLFTLIMIGSKSAHALLGKRVTAKVGCQAWVATVAKLPMVAKLARVAWVARVAAATLSKATMTQVLAKVPGLRICIRLVQGLTLLMIWSKSRYAFLLEKVPAKVGTSAKMGRIWMAHLIRIPTALDKLTISDRGNETYSYIHTGWWSVAWVLALAKKSVNVGWCHGVT
jgi:hypothetical protein